MKNAQFTSLYPNAFEEIKLNYLNHKFVYTGGSRLHGKSEAAIVFGLQDFIHPTALATIGPERIVYLETQNYPNLSYVLTCIYWIYQTVPYKGTNVLLKLEDKINETKK